MKKREKVLDMARTASFTVHITEKGQVILTSTMVSYEAWAGGVTWIFITQRSEVRGKINITNC